MYKCYFDKSNIELWKTHLSAISRICKLHIQISNSHMCVEAGPASQDAVIKSISASPGLQCRPGSCPAGWSSAKQLFNTKALRRPADCSRNKEEITRYLSKSCADFLQDRVWFLHIQVLHHLLPNSHTCCKEWLKEAEGYSWKTTFFLLSSQLFKKTHWVHIPQANCWRMPIGCRMPAR